MVSMQHQIYLAQPSRVSVGSRLTVVIRHAVHVPRKDLPRSSVEDSRRSSTAQRHRSICHGMTQYQRYESPGSV